MDVVVAGNSIGGFTATSVAAAMAERVRVTSSADDRNARNIHCAGLVLFNPSGKIEPPTASKTADIKGSGSEGASADDGDEYFPPYRGPAPEFLRLFGRGVVRYGGDGLFSYEIRSSILLHCRTLAAILYCRALLPYFFHFHKSTAAAYPTDLRVAVSFPARACAAERPC